MGGDAVDNPGIWSPRMGNTSHAFTNVGLPSSRDALAHLLGTE